MFFAGCYGMDKLNKTMLFTSIGLYVAAIVLSLILGVQSVAGRIIQGVALLLAVVALLRSFSRNFPARQKELAWYMNFENRIKGWWTKLRGRGKKVIDLNERRNYKHLTCPQCMQKLRVPRGKGKIMVTCTRCRNKFTTKT